MKVSDLVANGVEYVGVFLAAEVKRPDGKLRPDQERFLKEVPDPVQGQAAAGRRQGHPQGSVK